VTHPILVILIATIVFLDLPGRIVALVAELRQSLILQGVRVLLIENIELLLNLRVIQLQKLLLLTSTATLQSKKRTQILLVSFDAIDLSYDTRTVLPGRDALFEDPQTLIVPLAQFPRLTLFLASDQ